MMMTSNKFSSNCVLAIHIKSGLTGGFHYWS